ncbi:MAG TPA: Gfo/Idh/MocA family oxidoreductase [Candidatus Limnocylindrales bacterium]|nr:Gfo/Idh/MocA family oxidoreductase [Candidatus Limnocylindrales bacterium]
MRRPAEAPLGFALVGCGGAAADLARGIAGVPAARLVAVHDRDPVRAAAVAARHGCETRSSLAALLRDPAVDVVAIALPHDRLAPTAVAALRADHHVLVEKPGATTARGIRAIRDAAAAAGRSVGVVFELRQVSTVAAATALVRTGSLGRLRSVRIRTLIDKPADYWSAGPTGAVRDPWRASLARAGGGVALMNAIHQLDLVRAITGLEPLRVAGLTSYGIPGVEVEDVASATLEYRDGVLGSLVAAAHAPGAVEEETIELDGTDGSVRLGDPYAARPQLRHYHRAATGDARPAGWLELEPEPVDPFVATIRAFVGAIRVGRPPSPGLADVDVALATVLALYRSARTGRFERVRPVGPDAGPA